MSDFDKEAEREKLREKYERDREERQATQRMSDLLLKGATMTNAHCGTCGDPLFQMDGTTFCPSCHGNPDAVEGTDLEAQPAEQSADASSIEGSTESHADGEAASGSADGSQTSDAGDAEATGTDRQRPQGTDARPTADARPSSEDTTADAPSHDPRTRSDPSESASRTDAGAPDDAKSSTVSERPSSDRRVSAGRSTDGDLETAHASLVAALETFAAKAAATDDPRYATECLEAAREAAETLETLR